MSEITPVQIAAALFDPDGPDETVKGWLETSFTPGSSVVAITFNGSDEAADLPDVHFRAVVVEGEGPIVIASPEFLTAARALYRAHATAGSLSTEQAVYMLYEVQAALDALTPEQVAVLAGDAAEAAQAEERTK